MHVAAKRRRRSACGRPVGVPLLGASCWIPLLLDPQCDCDTLPQANCVSLCFPPSAFRIWKRGSCRGGSANCGFFFSSSRPPTKLFLVVFSSLGFPDLETPTKLFLIPEEQCVHAGPWLALAGAAGGGRREDMPRGPGVVDVRQPVD